MSDFPAGVGPHEGRELALMLSGLKPAAMFIEVDWASGYFPEADFAPHVAQGRMMRREEFLPGKDGHRIRCLYFALRGQEWRLDEIHAIQSDIFTGRRSATGEDDLRIGRLLGYSEDEIAAFLRHAGRSR